MGREGKGVYRRTFSGLTVLGSVVLCCLGCGYKAGFTMPENVKTIHVKVFDNKTFYRDLDFDMTQVVKREILSRTDLVVVREADADVVLSCAVNRVEKSILREDANDIPEEVEIRLTISAHAEDRAGKTLFRIVELSRSVNYVIVLGEDERFARSRALREVAEELVYRLAEGWGWREEEDKAQTETDDDVGGDESE